MSAGDFNCSLPGSVHEGLTTGGGALLILVSPRHTKASGRTPDGESSSEWRV
jgi:hypothetical protein